MLSKFITLGDRVELQAVGRVKLTEEEEKKISLSRRDFEDDLVPDEEPAAEEEAVVEEEVPAAEEAPAAE